MRPGWGERRLSHATQRQMENGAGFDVDAWRGVFVSLAPARVPRLYESSFDWDFGFLFPAGDRLCYVGCPGAARPTPQSDKGRSGLAAAARVRASRPASTSPGATTRAWKRPGTCARQAPSTCAGCRARCRTCSARWRTGVRERRRPLRLLARAVDGSPQAPGDRPGYGCYRGILPPRMNPLRRSISLFVLGFGRTQPSSSVVRSACCVGRTRTRYPGFDGPSPLCRPAGAGTRPAPDLFDAAIPAHPLLAAPRAAAEEGELSVILRRSRRPAEDLASTRAAARSSRMPDLEPLGDQSGAGHVRRRGGRGCSFADAVRRLNAPWVVDVVQAYATVAVFFDADRIGFTEATAGLRELKADDSGPTPGRLHQIPCCYGLNLDLGRVASAYRPAAGPEVIRLHAAPSITRFSRSASARLSVPRLSANATLRRAPADRAAAARRGRQRRPHRPADRHIYRRSAGRLEHCRPHAAAAGGCGGRLLSAPHRRSRPLRSRSTSRNIDDCSARRL